MFGSRSQRVPLLPLEWRRVRKRCSGISSGLFWCSGRSFGSERLRWCSGMALRSKGRPHETLERSDSTREHESRHPSHCLNAVQRHGQPNQRSRGAFPLTNSKHVLGLTFSLLCVGRDAEYHNRGSSDFSLEHAMFRQGTSTKLPTLARWLCRHLAQVLLKSLTSVTNKRLAAVGGCWPKYGKPLGTSPGHVGDVPGEHCQRRAFGLHRRLVGILSCLARRWSRPTSAVRRGRNVKHLRGDVVPQRLSGAVGRKAFLALSRSCRAGAGRGGRRGACGRAPKGSPKRHQQPRMCSRSPPSKLWRDSRGSRGCWSRKELRTQV